MSFPTTGPLAPDAPTSVFVDESGRRRARARVVARALVAGAAIYVLVVIAGLTGSVSLPGIRLGELHRVAPGRAHASPFGPGSKVLSLPAPSKAQQSTLNATPPASGISSGGTKDGLGASGPASGGTTGTGNTAKSPNTSHRPTTTTSPGARTTTTLAVTTTTKPHGPPTSTSHGPPSTKPGQGKGRNKL